MIAESAARALAGPLALGPPSLRYDPQADVLSIALVPMRPGIVDHDVELDDRRWLAIGHERRVIAIEVLDVSRGDIALDGMPDPAALHALLKDLAEERGWPNIVRGGS